MSCLGPEGSVRTHKVDRLGSLLQDVLDQYDWDTRNEDHGARNQAHAARGAAIDVLATSRAEVLTAVGHLTAQRDNLLKALKLAVYWLDMLTPVGDSPGMARIRDAVAEAEADLRTTPEARVSHGICMPCVNRLYPDMVGKVTAALARSAPVSSSEMARVCSYCGKLIEVRQ